MRIKERISRLTQAEKYAASQEHADLAGILFEGRRRYREQKGELQQWADGSWHVRFYADDPENEYQGRIKVSEPLPVEPNDHPDVIQKAFEKRMREVNNDNRLRRNQSNTELTIEDFWRAFYVPWMKGEGALRQSSIENREDLWEQTIKPAIGTRLLRRFSTADANAFLSGLARKRWTDKRTNITKIGLASSSLQQVRALLSGMFSVAKAKNMVENNPFWGLKTLAKVRKSDDPIEYSEQEMDAMFKELRKHSVKGALFFAFSAYAGLRPSETACLTWDCFDYQKGTFEIRNAAAYGRPDGLKTDKSRRTLLLCEPIKGLLAKYRKSNEKGTVYLFQRSGKRPVNHLHFVARHVNPHLKDESGKLLPQFERFCGLYAARRGFGTSMFNRTGDLRAVYQTLGNSLQTAMRNYIKPSKEEGRKGQELLERQYLERQQSTSRA